MIFLDHFLMFDSMWSKLSQATVTIGCLNSQDMIKILKQSEHDLSGKLNVMETVLRYYVMFLNVGQYST